uniref:Lipoprotein n=2 Tax=Litorilinea aerophila TaxID=1204385 RepID=A0A540VG41_9CHLR
MDGAGMTLYLFLRDEPNVSNCYDACASRWPPLLVDGEPVAGEGVDPALLGITERTDGTLQVTYNGWPLYYFARDERPGDTLGQGVGDVWYVISPTGEVVQ